MKRFLSNTARMSSKRVRHASGQPRSANICQIAFKVEGDVQGVNFRSFTQKQARNSGVTGFVANASDGSVRLEPVAPVLALTRPGPG